MPRFEVLPGLVRSGLKLIKACCSHLNANHLVMKDVGTEQWELATNIGVNSVILQPNIKKKKKYIYIHN